MIWHRLEIMCVLVFMRWKSEMWKYNVARAPNRLAFEGKQIMQMFFQIQALNSSV